MVKKTDKAEKKFRKAAEQGDAAAQFSLGHAHYLQAIETGDFEEALNWIQKAANQDYGMAQAHLGSMHVSGEGVPLDLGKSKLWFEKAAQRGHTHDQFTYATMCWNGDFGSHDPDEAEEWWLQAASQGSAEAHDALGAMYGRGHSNHRDLVQAYRWFTLAALQNEPGTSPGSSRAARDRMAGDMTTDQIAEADQLVQLWLVEHPQVMGEEMASDWRERVAEPPTPEIIAEAGKRVKKLRNSFTEEQLAEAENFAQKWMESYRRYEDDHKE